MKATARRRAFLAWLIVVASPALAVHLAKVITVADFIQCRIHHPEEGLTLLMLDDTTRDHIKIWQERLRGRSGQVVGPCRPPSDGGRECNAPPLPFFPWSDVQRNEMLLRPHPDIVRANIRQATNGSLSTVDELIARVDSNLDDLSVLADNELSLLMTSFAQPVAGLIAEMGCGPLNYSGWHEDLLISQDEQRALLAGFLHGVSDEGYFARRMAELEETMRSMGFVPTPDPEEEQCLRRLRRGTDWFLSRVEELDREVIISEAEWVRRYEEILDALRADVYALPAAERVSWDDVERGAEALVAAAEDMAVAVIQRNIPMVELGFMQLLGEQEEPLRHQFPDLHCGIIPRIAYRRWRTST